MFKNVATLQKKTIKNFKKEINKLREATRKTKLQIKKKTISKCNKYNDNR